MSFHILNTGASGLRAAQRSVETAAHNAANSTVDGYTRQRVSQTAMVPAPGADGVLGSGHRGTGVQVTGIERLRDVLADLALRAESDAAGSAEVRAEVLDRAQAVLGNYGAGLPDALSRLWAAFDQLSLAPAEPAARQIVIDTAVSVANGLNDAAVALQRIRADTIAQAESERIEVNKLSTEVANLNTHIVAARNGGQQPNDLLDRRDLLLDRLATLVGATSRANPDGSVTVSVKGAPIVQGSTAFAVTRPASGGGIDQEGADLVLEIHGQPATLGGRLGGRVSALATDLRKVEADLNTVARALALEVNLAHAGGTVVTGGDSDSRLGGYDLDGGAGKPLFTSTEERGFTASSIRVGGEFLGPDGFRRIAAASSASGVTFNGEKALEMAGLRARLATTMASTAVTVTGSPHTYGNPEIKKPVTLNQLLNAVASELGSRASGAIGAAETAQIAVAALKDQRSSANGVSLDEEMVELVKFQHSYDAAARVISIADEMLNTLINGLGAGR